MRGFKTGYLIAAMVTLSLHLSAAQTNEATVPPKTPACKDLNKSAKADIYTKFRKKVGSLSPSDRSKLRTTYKQKIDDEADLNHFEEATYYNHLYEILNSFD